MYERVVGYCLDENEGVPRISRCEVERVDNNLYLWPDKKADSGGYWSLVNGVDFFFSHEQALQAHLKRVGGTDESGL